jgi:hypothetical protein
VGRRRGRPLERKRQEASWRRQRKLKSIKKRGIGEEGIEGKKGESTKLMSFRKEHCESENHKTAMQKFKEMSENYQKILGFRAKLGKLHLALVQIPKAFGGRFSLLAPLTFFLTFFRGL